MRRSHVYLLAATALLLGIATACTATANAGPKGDGGTTITEIHLSDGTRCAVMDKDKGAALTCEWKTR